MRFVSFFVLLLLALYSSAVLSEEESFVLKSIKDSCRIKDYIAEDSVFWDGVISDKDKNISDYKYLLGDKFLMYEDLLSSRKNKMAEISSDAEKICLRLPEYKSIEESPKVKSDILSESILLLDEYKSEESDAKYYSADVVEYIINCGVFLLDKQLLSNVIPEDKYSEFKALKLKTLDHSILEKACSDFKSSLFNDYEIGEAFD